MCSVFCGGTFHFDVSGTRFTVHHRLVARHSHPLKAMMDNGMLESQLGSAPLQDAHVNTFARFVEWMYTGDYNAAPPEKPPPSSPPSPENDEKGSDELDVGKVEDAPVEEAQDYASLSDVAAPEPDAVLLNGLWRTPTLPRERKKAKKRRSYSYSEPPAEPPGPDPSTPKLPMPTSDVISAPSLPTNSMFVPDSNWSLDYLPLLLSHIHLYVFADKYDIQALQELAARRLDEALDHFPYFDGSATNIADLIHYVYDHTLEDEGEQDILRNIVTIFAADNIKVLNSSAEFHDLLKSGGAFSSAVVSKMSERLQL